MSLTKGIKYGKEHRKEYYDSRAVDRTCCSHGSCPWCMGNRFHKYAKQNVSFEQQLKEYMLEKKSKKKATCIFCTLQNQINKQKLLISIINI